MSIAAQTQKALRSFRSLIEFARAARVFIKDLKDLEKGTTRFSIDIKDLKDLKTSLDNGRSRGIGPRATVRRAYSCRSRAPALDPIAIRRSQTTEEEREGQALALRTRKKKCAGACPPRYGDRNGYFRRFNAPNVVSIRFAAETGPGNNRVTNVSGLPSNATSSIW